jgi:rod shape-determining protein MreC
VLRKDREKRNGKYLSILLCIILGVTLGVIHNRNAQKGRSDAFTSVIRTATSPFIGAISGTGKWFNRQFGWLIHGKTLAAENRVLRSQNQALQEEVAQLREDEIDAQRLRSELGFASSPPYHKIPAVIIAIRPNPNFETMTIQRGSRDGIRPDSVVVSPQGVVGHIFDVGLITSSVLLLTDSNSAIGAMVQRMDSRSIFVCKGNGTSMLSVAYLDRNADIRIGDTIISSGLGGQGGIYPKGLVIGTVYSITTDVADSSRHILIKPAVNFDRLEEVYILQ